MLFDRSAVLLGALLLFGCERSVEQKAAPTEPAAVMVPSHESLPGEEFSWRLVELVRALPPKARAIEIRSLADVSEMQGELEGETFSQMIRCKMAPPEWTLIEGRAPCRISERRPADVFGEGSVENNAFDPSPLRPEKIAGAFNLARQSSGEPDAAVTEVVIRRYLPQSRQIIARLRVSAPSFSSYVDTNARGVLIKR